MDKQGTAGGPDEGEAQRQQGRPTAPRTEEGVTQEQQQQPHCKEMVGGAKGPLPTPEGESESMRPPYQREPLLLRDQWEVEEREPATAIASTMHCLAAMTG